IQALLLFVQAVKQFPVHFRSFLCFFFSLYHIINQSHSCKDYFFASPYFVAFHKNQTGTQETFREKSVYNHSLSW
ncbi:MAG: hypothetical protein IJQ81_04580, partial [Oscillibacter sp.]|nr:hypothetical protein [Oscillibacter sp.]